MTWVLPTTRLVDAVRRAGFDVYVVTKHRDTTTTDDEVDTTVLERTFFVLSAGTVVATVKSGVIPSEATTYGDDDAVINSIVARYGSVSRSGANAPELPMASRSPQQLGTDLVLSVDRVTSSIVLEFVGTILLVLLVFAVMFGIFWAALMGYLPRE